MHQLIRASAGSGKTFQLSGHFLKQLFSGHRPETILATTFTRKAASEILGRVLMSLADAAESPARSKDLRERLRISSVDQQSSLSLLVEVTRNLHRMRVCTLDSFFQMVARSLSLELGLPPGWRIIDDNMDYELQQQAVDAVLSQHASRDAQQLMQMLAKGRSKRSVRDLIHDAIDAFYDLFQLTERDAWHQFPNQRRLTQAERERALEELATFDPGTDSRLRKARDGDLEKFRAMQWEAFAVSGIPAKISAGDLTYYKKDLPPEMVAAYQPLVAHARAELVDQLAQQTHAVWELMSRFDREYTRLRLEQGWMRFGDITRALSRAESAADSEKMNFRLDSSIRHLLLDEFQDTSPDQWRILKRLVQNIIRQQDEASIFCVGDGKQAIYGWRGGVAAILDAVQETIPDVSPMSLDRSYRSSPPVISTVNRIFSDLLRHGDLDTYESACERWSAAFPPHSTSHDSMVGHVQLRTSPVMEGESAQERRSPWNRWVAEQIQAIHHQSPDREIGVLTRRNSTVAALVHELRLLGVPASEEGGTPPVDSPAVLAVMSLLQLCSHPGCQISRYHVAGSPIGTVINLTHWQDDERAHSVAAEFRSRLMDQGYGRTLQWLSDSVRDHCSQRDLMRMRQIVAAGWQFDQSPSLNPVDFVRVLEGSRFMKSEPAPVRVMTIHQSKGLEFDIVVLPELDGQLIRPPVAAAGGPGPESAPTHVSMWRSREVRGLLPGPLQDAFEQTTARQLAEAICLLYVAVTRAKHSLQMMIPPVLSGKIPKTWAGLLLASLTDQQTALPDAVLYEAGDAQWSEHLTAQQAHRQKRKAQATTTTEVTQPATRRNDSRAAGTVRLAPMTDGRRRGLARHAPSRHDDSGVVYLPTSGPSTNSRVSPEVDPRTKGNLIHAWFQCIEWLQPGQRPDPLLLRSRAFEMGMQESVINTLLPDFFAMLEQPQTRAAITQETELRSDLFTAAASRVSSDSLRLVVLRERPFVLLQEGAVVQGSIDRLVIAYHGNMAVAAHILDFKTDRLYGDRDEWIQFRQQFYAAQLEQYCSAVNSCFGIAEPNIRAHLVLLEADVVVSTGVQH
jgi:ATP-dependent helicase/nuclease subunit A